MSFYNKWLRAQADLPLKHRNTLTICTHTAQELELALASIRQFVEVMNYGKERIEVISKQGTSDGIIELSVGDSKEMCS